MFLKAIPRQSQELSLKEFLILLKSLLTNDRYLQIFEKEMAACLGVKKTIAFFSLRQGLFWTLKALGYKKGEEIILPAYEYFAVLSAILQAGLKPVFVDVNPSDYTIDVSKIRKAISPKTRAILVAHLNGYPAEMGRIMEIARKNNLRVIEDSAHALGASYKKKSIGSFDIGCFSFGLGKPISTAGGGLIATLDQNLARKLKEKQNQFQEISFFEKIAICLKIITARFLTFPRVFFLTSYPLLLLKKQGLVEEKINLSKKVPASYQLKYSGPQAALAREQLKNLPRRNLARLKNAEILNQKLSGIKAIRLPIYQLHRKSAYLHYPVEIKEVDKVVRKALLAGFNLQKDYCSNLPGLLPKKRIKAFFCPVTDNLEGRVVYLPNHPSLSSRDVWEMAKKIAEITKK